MKQYAEIFHSTRQTENKFQNGINNIAKNQWYFLK